MPATARDKSILRELTLQYMEIASLPVQKEKAELWRKLNRLEAVRPLVWINEIPWHEMNVENELTLQCTDAFCRGIENRLRMTLYQWRHMPGDMVVDPVLHCGTVHSPRGCYEGWGIQENAVRSDDAFGSVQYVPVITSEADIEKVQTPQVTVDRDATEHNYQLMCEIFDGIAPVEKRGIVHWWASPWDVMVHWYGIEQLYIDMIDRPQLVHKLLRRFMDGSLEVLDRQEKMGLLSVSNGNHRVGSGGLGITDELPQPDFDGVHVRPIDQWGTSTGQIFSEVSPDMHEEFCLQYEREWLARFGLNCYGCCEPLHKKMHLMRTIPRLRRISMSPWVHVSEAAEKVGADYIFSHKPNVLQKVRNCRVEIIMKDISTVRNEPQRLWAWEKIAMEMAEGV